MIENITGKRIKSCVTSKEDKYIKEIANSVTPAPLNNAKTINALGKSKPKGSLILKMFSTIIPTIINKMAKLKNINWYKNCIDDAVWVKSLFTCVATKILTNNKYGGVIIPNM